MGAHSRKTVELRDPRLAGISAQYSGLQREHDLLCQSIHRQVFSGQLIHYDGDKRLQCQCATIDDDYRKAGYQAITLRRRLKTCIEGRITELVKIDRLTENNNVSEDQRCFGAYSRYMYYFNRMKTRCAYS